MKNRTQAMVTEMAVICLILLFLGVGAQGAPGEKYPTKPIEILVPWTPGGSADIMSRIIADVGVKYLKQPMVVVNKPGAMGSVAAAEILSSKPDGYKLFMATSFFKAVMVKTQKVPFNADNLDPIASFFDYSSGILVRSDSPWKTLRELVEYARENPNKLKVSTIGPSTTHRLIIMQIFKGTKLIEIPYTGSTDVLPALLGGHIDFTPCTYQPAKGLIQAGKLKMLVVFNDHRFRDLRDVPTLVDLGYVEAAKIKSLNGLVIHKDTPEEIKKILIDTCKKIQKDPQFKKGLENFVEELKLGGPELFNKAVEDAREIGIPLVKELGLYIEQ